MKISAVIAVTINTNRDRSKCGEACKFASVSYYREVTWCRLFCDNVEDGTRCKKCTELFKEVSDDTV